MQPRPKVPAGRHAAIATVRNVDQRSIWASAIVVTDADRNIIAKVEFHDILMGLMRR